MARVGARCGTTDIAYRRPMARCPLLVAAIFDGGGTVMRGGYRPERRRLILIRTVAAAAVAALGAWLVVLTMPAEAATWTSTYNVSASGWLGTDSPTVAVDRQGDALLVWTACDNSNTSGCYYQVQARIKPASGSMGSIKTLSPLGAVSAWPQAASDDDGDSAVVWEQDGKIVGRRISATGAVSSLRTLSTTRAMNPSVAVEPSGRAFVVWTAIETGSQTVGRYFAKDGTLGPEVILGGGSSDQPGVAIDRNGTAIAVWTELNDRVVAKRVRPGYVSAPIVVVSPVYGVRYARVSVAVDRDGDAIITYRQVHNGELPHVRARLLSRTGTLGSVRYVSPSTDNVTFYSALAMDLDGDSMVIWSRQTSTTQSEVFGRRIYRTGTLGSITRLGVGDRPAVTLDDDGDGLAVWHSPGPPYEANQVYARTISRTGVFGAADKLSSDGRVPRTDASPGGRFSVIWQQKSYPYQIRARIGQ